jgi:hypothetical protein
MGVPSRGPDVVVEAAVRHPLRDRADDLKDLILKSGPGVVGFRKVAEIGVLRNQPSTGRPPVCLLQLILRVRPTAGLQEGGRLLRLPCLLLGRPDGTRSAGGTQNKPNS